MGYQYLQNGAVQPLCDHCVFIPLWTCEKPHSYRSVTILVQKLHQACQYWVKSDQPLCHYGLKYLVGKVDFQKRIHIDNSNYWEWEGDGSILPRSVLLNLNCFSQFSWGHFSVNRCYFIPGKHMAKCYLKQWTFQNGGDKLFAPIFLVKMMRITHEYSYL